MINDPTFQSPEGDSLFFYAKCSNCGVAYVVPFQSPEGDSLFFYQATPSSGELRKAVFQSPEGDSLFFYDTRRDGQGVSGHVSVPRRGFVVFLPSGRVSKRHRDAGFSPPKGIRCFSTRTWHMAMHRTRRLVSVPRRGFVVFLREAPSM